ncbi:4-diphosphocytidyl-2-C-methyl-D-erythritol kinase [Bisgaardia hudsonensis]|uniref:4-diphosphocytidyl-2-C-methyl-D-erythritol kinase n=1 Tax=Bisgaardia hudsonensis TaxID=109472 RepID=A0A4R2N1Q4_9PAST|nr:4-(cytidine 5'-diphospho)-2-C-methyl-D-erythritol kinase [Bisgaardia hudsonensis]QLB12937.1 4-(cytidine 5'-diphospho)-2-C-methyl-D-erythritol kinase [Bisgaardia hudsonensis]TCP13502.1 4-diphosphocytidyl-2-C-methyl-D-erythritol kinase [Bisgaardia hudsonensis]
METYRFSTALLSEIKNIKQGEPIRFPSPAKLNLFLYINNKRDDGYHELQTLFQFLDFGDWLTINSTINREIHLVSPITNLNSQDNLIYKAAKNLQEYTNCKLGASIHLDKILPIGGGVGGGSSNAATTLIALNYLWNTQLSLKDLCHIGLKLGADVPIFLHGKSAFAEGVGEKITYCEPPEKWFVVLKPNVSISTASIFNDPHLPRNSPKLSLSELLNKKYENDCEKIVLNHYSEVEETYNWLLQYAPARLTGTGACVFAEFNDKKSAQSAFLAKPDKIFGFIAKGSNISPLHKLMGYLLK